MSESIPLEDSASQQTICDFDLSTVPSILNTTELDPIEGIEESLGYSRSPNTSIQSTKVQHVSFECSTSSQQG